ncbi:PAS domain-containing protein [Dongia sp.]|uniref:PAS domain-containing protein n=1 Tax=Dongia sp. TaxID=1977262 RepID=UPI0035B490E4
MARANILPTGVECPYGPEELIVSKTNLKGRITYANDVFLRLARYSAAEVIGAPHNLIRHPDMPRSIFKLLWESIQAKKEIFAYVLNMAKNGDHYWVFAHVTPTLDSKRNVTGFHSNRRKPDPVQIDRVKPLYAQILAEEKRHDSRKDGMLRGVECLSDVLKSKGVDYDEFVFSL